MTRLSEHKRKAVGDALRASVENGESVRAIARRIGVSVSTVNVVRLEIGHNSQRTGTKKAIEAIKVDHAARRAALTGRLLDVATRALDDMESPATIYNFGGKDNTYNSRTVDRPPTGDQRNLATIAAIALDKHRMLDQYDAQAGMASAVDDWLSGMVGKPRSGETPL